MRKGYVLSAVIAAVLAGGAASAAVIPTTVSATGSYNGNLAVLNDGVVPANGSNYNDADKVNFTASGNASFQFDFGGAYNADGLLANVDNNDFYSFAFFDGANQVGQLNIGPGEGVVGFGVETFNRFFASFRVTSVVVTASGGDSLYGIGEVQFTGGAINAAVPEPSTWAMMIGGFALAGAAARRRTARTVLA
jgi:hypothetical protein